MATRWMSAAVCSVAIVGVASTAAGQAGGTQAGGTQTGGTQAGTQTSPADRANSSAADGQFIEKMMMANMAEIQLGQLASTRAQSAEVKSYAQMMIADHTKANQQLQPLAQKMGRQAPTALDEKHKAIADRLSKLQGDEFDREFMKVMVQSHQEVLSDAKSKAAGAGGGPAPTATSGAAGRTPGSATAATGTAGSTPAPGSAAMPQSAHEYAANTAPIVQQHLEQAQRLQKSLDK